MGYPVERMLDMVYLSKPQLIVKYFFRRKSQDTESVVFDQAALVGGFSHENYSFCVMMGEQKRVKTDMHRTALYYKVEIGSGSKKDLLVKGESLVLSLLVPDDFFYFGFRY